MTNRTACLLIPSAWLALGVFTTARGDVVVSPSEGRFMQVTAEAEGIVDNKIVEPPHGFPMMWGQAAQAKVDGVFNHAEADSVLGSYASTSSLSGNGQASGYVGGVASFYANSNTEFRFTVQGCETFGYFSELGAASNDIGSAQFEFLAIFPESADHETIGEQTLYGTDPQSPPSILYDNGQLSDGHYLVRGLSLVNRTSQQGTHSAPDYSWVFNFTPCLVALIDQQPIGGTIAAGDTATLSVGAAAAAAAAAASGPSPADAGGFTYQWRHGGVDLVDGGRITGATTDTLTISNFGSADAGGYNVWVSDGSTRQLSSLAVLRLPPVVPALPLAGLGLAAAALLLTGIRAVRTQMG